jgi:hypothetical protein
VIDHNGAIELIEPGVKYEERRGNIVPEVLSGLGDSLAIKADDNATELLVTMSDIEVNLRHLLTPVENSQITYLYLVRNFGALGRLGRLRKEDKRNREDQKNRNNESLEGSHDD